MITRTRDIQPALRHLEAALEGTCATLMALESAKLPNEGSALDPSAVQGQISMAIAALRNAMSELRALHRVEASAVAYGFVLADPEWSRTRSRWRGAEGAT